MDFAVAYPLRLLGFFVSRALNSRFCSNKLLLRPVRLLRREGPKLIIREFDSRLGVFVF